MRLFGFMILFALMYGPIDFWLILSPFIANYTGYIVDRRFLFGYQSTIWIFVAYAALLTLTCVLLACKMYKLHRYEFKRNILQFTVYTGLLQLFFSVNVWKVALEEPLHIYNVSLREARQYCDETLLMRSLGIL